ncbi:M20 family metallopeptidase [Microvirga brassicacearum]|uniref:M20 family metallopeptidase n=1 Tax=Microvirga brassicacearum TaxID=2580413 RepID=A0A5N3P6D4_9HYPH|nr:M20 family metallopeptidase [Microvirga brassicacearum]KAB0265306.1 M20 family metallopeptidase [Microvirga brassicacearum]
MTGAAHPGLVDPAEIDPAPHLARIGEWVDVETPTDDGPAVTRLVAKIHQALTGDGIDAERIAGQDGLGDHLLARVPGRGNGPGVLVMAHLDTVWPVGTLAMRPFRLDGDRAYGPGIYDMKAGGYLALAALRYLARSGSTPELPVTLLFTSDEEIGSPTSRALIEAESRRARYVLVPEPSIGPDRAVVTSRKGWGRFRLRVEGRPAHAGGNHQEGRSAVLELARQIVALEGLTDYARGVTVNVGVMRGGTRLNVVPAEAEADIDVRIPSLAEAERVMPLIYGRQPLGADVRVVVEGELNRPPFERTPGVVALYRTAKTMAQELGFDLPETSRGGVSDGNFAAALGIPTLDGLGCAGDGAHAEHEHILISSIPERLALMIRLMATLA